MSIPVFNYQASQVIADTQALLGDVNGTRFSSAQLYDAINWGIKQMNVLMGYTYIETSIPQNQPGSPPIGDQFASTIPPWACFSLYGLYPDGTTSYDLTDYIQIKTILFGYGPKTYGGGVPSFASPYATIPLNKTIMEEEDIYFPGWRNTYGIPQRWDFYDSSRIAVFPFPYSQISSNINGYLIIGYVQQPALMSVPSDYVDDRIPDRVQQYIKYAAASWLLSLDQSDTTSLQTAKLYLDTFIQLLQAKPITP
jgi:hypothetical protein